MDPVSCAFGGTTGAVSLKAVGRPFQHVADLHVEQIEMGRVFKHVSDGALRSPEGATTCNLCKRSNVPVFTYAGEIVDMAKAQRFAPVHREVDELCAECITSGLVRSRYTDDAQSLINRFAADQTKAWQEYHQLPWIPDFCQHFDWPMCCGGWTNFTGSPHSDDDLLALKERILWQNGPSDEPGRDFDTDGPPEDLEEISLFECPSCHKRYFTDQWT